MLLIITANVRSLLHGSTAMGRQRDLATAGTGRSTPAASDDRCRRCPRDGGVGHKRSVVKQESSRSTLAVSGPQRRTLLQRMEGTRPAVAGSFDEPART